MIIPAAQYLRMSTDHQQYSLDNQADAIAKYAANFGFVIVKTYSDAAKSGLRLRNREGLKQLLKDVVEGNVSFKAILVYDVSRWGRFQDSDEAAHYEYLCKSSGTPVYYCAEQFPNDNSPMGLIMKALKRTMAGEYSRELSVKVKAGLARLAKMGFKVGGHTPFGLRRQLLDANGKRKQFLRYGERKSVVDDRVILVPGPAKEVATVQRIFREFADGNNMKGIAKELNDEHVQFTTGHPWTTCTVRNVLRNQKYIGKQVWGRTTEHLSSVPKKLPEDQWVVCENAIVPIVSLELFQRVQARFAGFTHRLSNEELLERLKPLLQQHGKLSSVIIDEACSCPSLTTYGKRFGGLMNVYRQLGCNTPELWTQASNRFTSIVLRDALVQKLLDTFPAQLRDVRKGRRFRTLLRYRKTGLLIAVVTARHHRDKNGDCWIVDVPKKERNRAAVVAFINLANEAVESFRVFARLGCSRLTVRVGRDDEWLNCGLPLAGVPDFIKILELSRVHNIA